MYRGHDTAQWSVSFQQRKLHLIANPLLTHSRGRFRLACSRVQTELNRKPQEEMTLRMDCRGFDFPWESHSHIKFTQPLDLLLPLLSPFQIFLDAMLFPVVLQACGLFFFFGRYFCLCLMCAVVKSLVV